MSRDLELMDALNDLVKYANKIPNALQERLIGMAQAVRLMANEEKEGGKERGTDNGC